MVANTSKLNPEAPTFLPLFALVEDPVTQQRPPQTPVGIQSLPLEIFEGILSELEGNKRDISSLPVYARVARSWTEVCLSMLYRQIVLHSQRQAELLARTPGALMRYPVRVLEVEASADVEARTISRLLDHCDGLVELILGSWETYFQTDFFRHPSLQSLEVLRMISAIRCQSPLQTFPFKLRHLTSYLNHGEGPGHAEFLQAIAHSSCTTLTSLEISTFLAEDHFSRLYPLAPNLSTLAFSALVILPHDINSYPSPLFFALEDFLSHATALKRLHLSFAGLLTREALPFFLPIVFNAIGSNFLSLKFALQPKDASEKALQLLMDFVATSRSLSSLSELIIWIESWKVMVAHDQWSEFMGLLGERGIKLMKTEEP